jgi:N-formylglutamate deformylase
MVYSLEEATTNEVPIIISVPHCGTAFPDELKNQYKPALINAPEDTDWFVNTLYDFAPSFGITMIAANYSRWVIDLNRDPFSKPLYADGRIITGLCPTTTFLGEPIYKDERNEVIAPEVKRRLDLYFNPYHQQIDTLLQKTKQKFGKVLLWDCHSIRQLVPTIHKDKFPDLILGDADGTTASPGLIEAALSILDHGEYSVNHNSPFKGGYITRHYGKPSENQHALQLEMTKVNYMDDTEKKYDAIRATKIQDVLKSTFEKLIEVLENPSPRHALRDTPLPRERGRGEGVEVWTRNKTPDTILTDVRSMRKSGTEAENILWEHLRNKKLDNLKFRRQQPMEGFILDFYCQEAKMGVEVDGEIHLDEEQKKYDQQRTEYLSEFGIKIIRFNNDSVMNDISEVLSVIKKEVHERIGK